MAAHDTTDTDFRRRRLSLPLSKMMNGGFEDGEDDEVDTPVSPSVVPEPTINNRNMVNGNPSATRTADLPSPPTPPEDSSFRKRRLSLTNVSSHPEPAMPVSQQVVSPSPQKKKPCRGKAATSSSGSAGATTANQTSGLGVVGGGNNHRSKSSSSSSASMRLAVLPSRILHASELDDDATHRPTNVFHHSSQQPHDQPRWKRRMTLDVISDVDKLPFPPDIVGTYSYHGIEPAYDDDDDVGDDEEEQERDKEPASSETIRDDAAQAPRLPTLQQLIENSTASGGSSILFPADSVLGTDGERDDTIPGIMPAPSESIAKINQDRGGVVYPYVNSSTTALFAVYDGHGQGGELVSQFALSEIQQRLGKHPQFRTNVTQAFADTFRAVDEALRDEPLIDPMFAGTTACVALLDGRTLYTANLGDSRAVCARRCVIGRSNSSRGRIATTRSPSYYHKAIDLTVDQNPDNPSEQRRIVAAGGHVTPPPAPGLSARVWLDSACTQVGLAMARSLGDHAAATVGVIADPVTTVHTVDPNDEFIILATDGVWEFISSQQAVDIVQSRIMDQGGATTACQALIKAAAKRWQEEEGSYRDDITAIVVKLQCLWDYEDATANS